MTEQIVYLNGQWLPIDEAKVPVLDRGFIFGDGIYEVVPIYNGRPFRWEQHLNRLQRSLDKIGIVNPHSREHWTDLVKALQSKHAWQDGA
jgi:D-alanine transaminase